MPLWRMVERLLSGVRRSRYSGRTEKIGASRFLSKPPSSAMPTNSAITPLVMDPVLCRVFASCGTTPIHVDPRMSPPAKYCSYTSTPRRATTTPCGSAPVSLARLGPVAQISFGSSPCCADVETSHTSGIAAGAPQSADIAALAIAVRSATHIAAAAIRRIPVPSRRTLTTENMAYPFRMSRPSMTYMPGMAFAMAAMRRVRKARALWLRGPFPAHLARSRAPQRRSLN